MPKVTFKEKFQDAANLRSFLMMLILVTVGIPSGNIVTNYVSTIFDLALSTSDGHSFPLVLSSNIIGVVMLFGCFLAMVTIDRFGRKPLLLTGLIVSCLSMLGLGTWFYLMEKGLIPPIGWLPLICLGLFVAANIAGPVNVFNVFIGELFNFEVRSFFATIIYTYSAGEIFVSVFIFNPLVKLIGIHSVLWIFALLNIFTILYTVFFVPETKQRTIEQIREELLGKRNVYNTKL